MRTGILAFLFEDIPVEGAFVLAELVDDAGGVVWADAAGGESDDRLFPEGLDETRIFEGDLTCGRSRKQVCSSDSMPE